MNTTTDTTTDIATDIATDHFFTVSSIPGLFKTELAAVDAWIAAKRPVPKASSVWLTEHNSPTGYIPTKTLAPCMSRTCAMFLGV